MEEGDSQGTDGFGVTSRDWAYLRVGMRLRVISEAFILELRQLRELGTSVGSGWPGHHRSRALVGAKTAHPPWT